MRLAFLQVRDNGEFAQMGLQQRVRTIDLPAHRGQILDRFGMPLALTREARDVYANPALVTDPDGEAEVIAEILGLPKKEVRSALESEGTFVFLDRQIDMDLAEELEAQLLPGIGFLDVPQRYYPAGSLAPQVLGLVDVDGKGISGLESPVSSPSSRGLPASARPRSPPTGCPSPAA